MIRIEALSKSYGPRYIIKKQSYHFPEGQRIALVGRNGAGKSTLLNILCGIEQPDEGSVIKPNGCRIGYLPQEPTQNPRATVSLECQGANVELLHLEEARDAALKIIEEDPSPSNLEAFDHFETSFREKGGYEIAAQAEKILMGLGSSQEDLQKNPKQLSGGWRMRVELAKLFLMDPEFMILDEPTNHLDLPSLLWVERYLRTYKGTLLFVSHDRGLLNKLATHTLSLSQALLTAYTGNYDAYLVKQKEDLANADRTRKNIEGKKAQLQTFVDSFGAKASKATQAQSKRKAIEKLDEELERIPIAYAEDDIHFKIPAPTSLGRIAYRIEGGDIGYSKTLCDGIELEIERGQKIAVIGANGIGKSTLLKTIVGKIPALAGSFQPGAKAELSYFAQDQLDVLDAEASVLQNVTAHSPLTEREARSLLGSFLFRGDDVFKTLKVLSGGEKSRVGLACALARKANILLLDEPTNHLDMSSMEQLQEALQLYEGTMIFVSHDRAFIDAVCTHVFVMTKDGRSMLFMGKLEDYQRTAAERGFIDVLGDTPTPSLPSVVKKPQPLPEERSREQGKEKAKAKKRLSQVEEELRKAESALAAVDAELALAGANYALCQELDAKRVVLAAKRESLEEEWLSLSEL